MSRKIAQADQVTSLKLHEGDTGSTGVQVALLTAEITSLTVHLQNNAKDFASRRSLLKKVATRKRLLRYLQRKNQDMYKNVITVLGLKR